MWLLIAVPIGILTALRPRSLLDKGSMVFVLIGISAHPVWISLMLSYFLGARLGWFPVGDYCNFFADPQAHCGGAVDWASHLILPWLTFAFLFAALYARMLRAQIIELLQEDFVRTAYAKGAPTSHIVRKHVLPNAMLPIVAMLGMDVGVAFAGALFIESTFGLPGIGQLLYSSATASDLPVVMGVMIVVSLAVAICTVLADVVCAILDPRTNLRSSRDHTVPSRLRRARRAVPARATPTT
jgi:peptide/nickel transport system permease protein